MNWGQFWSSVGLKTNPAKLDVANDEVATGASADQDGGTVGHSLLCVNTINATVVKASAGRLYTVDLLNLHATETRNIRFYDKATAPDPSADTALFQYQHVQWGQSPAKEKPPANLSPGLAFANGIAYVVTKLLTDTDETAIGSNECVVNLTYK